MTTPSLKTLNETTIAAAFNAHREEMKAEFVAHVESQLTRLINAYGETIGAVRKASSSFTYHSAYRVVTGLLDSQGLSSFKAISALPAKLCPARLEKAAEAYAVETVDALVFKVLVKVGELEDAELRDVFAGRFLLTGKRGGHDVVIRQTRILNVSKKGKLFHQWPAKIKLDGKVISAKAFSKLPAPAPAAELTGTAGAVLAALTAPMTLAQISDATGINPRTIRAALLFGKHADRFAKVGKAGRAALWARA